MRAAGTYRVRLSWRPVARGLGSINCNPFPFTGGQGLVEPTCWCLTVGPMICDGVAGKGTYAAALAVNSGGPSAPAPPPIVPAIDPNTPPPSSADEANATINSVIAEQWQNWKNQNSAFFTNIANAAEANTPGGGSSGTGLSTTAIAGIAIGGIALILLITSGRRSRR